MGYTPHPISLPSRGEGGRAWRRHQDRTVTSTTAVKSALDTAEKRLLAARNADGHWRGRLSDSALSTATAVVALTEVTRQQDGPARDVDLASLAANGRRWLIDNVNDDGGFGDTVPSVSNLSTTVLCWAALTQSATTRDHRVAREAARWIEVEAGSLEPATLKSAIEASYGDDRTFSIPILTHCAIAGVLGPRQRAFDGVTRLPFELAALPQSWFRFLGLPVVSYALPALIAVGQVQHHHRRPKIGPVAALRDGVIGPTLRRLRGIQPSSGGYLEAIPLTAFVTMSLAAAGRADDPVAKEGVRFLAHAMRPDGAWPIDIDLATWVTTLSVQALTVGVEQGVPSRLGDRERAPLRDWLLGQQYRQRHPFTGADPGGWAWTDLPGGVPDADDTAGALLALRALGDVDARTIARAEAGLEWLLGLENRDGGIPTFCRGWGTLPFDQSAPDLTAHALRAFAAWRDDVSPRVGKRLDRARRRLLRYLAKTQRPDGAWVPLWFGNERVANNENPTFGTARTLRALVDADDPATESMRSRARDWLVRAQHASGGWGGDVAIEPSIEETALALDALAGSADVPTEAVDRGVDFLIDRVLDGGLDRAAPIGFYFANLWYFEDLYPTIFAVSALRRVAATRGIV